MTGYGPVAIAFLGVVVGLGLWAAPAALRFAKPSLPVMDGSVVRAFEKYYDESFPIRIASVNLWTAAQLKLFGEGRQGVIIGKDDWLYTYEEFNVLPDWKAAIASNLKFIEWAHAQLTKAGVPLVVVIVPEKAHIYPEHIGSVQQAPAHTGLAARLTSAPFAASIPFVDLVPVLSAGRDESPTYFRTDTHWTPHGAELAAKAIVAKLAELSLTDPAAKSGAFVVERGAEVTHRGDLLAFLPLEPMFPSMMPPLEMIQQVKTVAADPAASGDGLFGDAPIPAVALVGTSYSANVSWNFAGFLEAGLGELVANYAKEGNGPFPPMAAYLTGEDFKANKPRVVIWEIPERALPSRPALDSFKLPPEATGGDQHATKG